MRPLWRGESAGVGRPRPTWRAAPTPHCTHCPPAPPMHTCLVVVVVVVVSPPLPLHPHPDQNALSAQNAGWQRRSPPPPTRHAANAQGPPIEPPNPAAGERRPPADSRLSVSAPPTPLWWFAPLWTRASPFRTTVTARAALRRGTRLRAATPACARSATASSPATRSLSLPTYSHAHSADFPHFSRSSRSHSPHSCRTAHHHCRRSRS